MEQNKKITICACVSRSFIKRDKAIEVAASLQREGFEVRVVPDLCKMIAQRSPDLHDIALSVIIACYPRPVKSLFRSVGLQTNQILDIRNGEFQDIFNWLQLSYKPTRETENEFRKALEDFPVEDGTDVWFPSIDKDRCCECGKCHDFCLFGVYAKENAEVKVIHPQNCKNNCPACARVCPNMAIIFPKYEKSPINGGLDDEEQISSLDTKALYNEALRMRLEQRRAKVSLLKKEGNDI